MGQYIYWLYVASNFIGQLHLRVRVNFTLDLVGNVH